MTWSRVSIDYLLMRGLPTCSFCEARSSLSSLDLDDEVSFVTSWKCISPVFPWSALRQSQVDFTRDLGHLAGWYEKLLLQAQTQGL